MRLPSDVMQAILWSLPSSEQSLRTRGLKLAEEICTPRGFDNVFQVWLKIEQFVKEVVGGSTVNPVLDTPWKIEVMAHWLGVTTGEINRRYV